MNMWMENDMIKTLRILLTHFELLEELTADEQPCFPNGVRPWSTGDVRSIVKDLQHIIVALSPDKRADLEERLEYIARWVDQDQHDKWCLRKDTPVNGFSGEGRTIREAITTIQLLKDEKNELINQNDSLAYDRDVHRNQCIKLISRVEEAEKLMNEELESNASSRPAGDYAELVADLTCEDYRHEMQHLRSSAEIDRLFQQAATAISLLVAKRNSPWTDVTPHCAEYLAAITRAETAEDQVMAMEEALEQAFDEGKEAALKAYDRLLYSPRQEGTQTKHFRTKIVNPYAARTVKGEEKNG